MNNMYGNPGFQNQGVGYAMQRRQPNFTQPLDPETIRKMRGGQNKRFTTKITKEEQNRAICTHKDPDRNNEFAFVDEADGSVTCYICGANFNLIDYTKEEVRSAVDTVLEIIQNIKTVYLDIPMNVATEYMTMMVFLDRLPELYDIAYSNFDSYDRVGHYGQQTNAFGVFNTLMSPGYGMNPQQMGGGGYGGYPGYNPQMGGGQQPVGNPFGAPMGYENPQNPQNKNQKQEQSKGTNPYPNQNNGYGQPNVNINPGVFNI